MSEVQAQASESLNQPVVESTETPAPVAPAVGASDGSYTTGRLEATLLRFGTLGELMALFVRAKRWWMLPFIGLLGLLGLGLAGLQAVEYIAPFIYAVF
ncbi:MAG: DUF5989 family protein [Myxococcota bacterium]|nr:DUF5989 family protein [Myxococcota bacterium]